MKYKIYSHTRSIVKKEKWMSPIKLLKFLESIPEKDFESNGLIEKEKFI